LQPPDRGLRTGDRPGKRLASDTFTRNTGGAINYDNNSGPNPGPPNSGFTVTRSDFTANAGSGINCTIGGSWRDVTISRSRFTANSDSAIDAGDPGGGGVAITVTDSAFTRNTSSQDGGAIDLSNGGGELTADRDTFTGNTSTMGGGGLYVEFPLDAQVNNSDFISNSAPVGGGIENEGTMEITGSAFCGNTASSDGGALYNDDGATVAGTTFSQNAAHSDGGAIYQAYNPALTRSSTNATLSVTGSQIRGNYAGQYGGGIDNAIQPSLPGYPAKPATATLTSSQVTANHAGQDGGGIYNLGGGTVTLTGSAVAGNHPDNCAPARSVPGCQG
jgi:hypothetical protein